MLGYMFEQCVGNHRLATQPQLSYTAPPPTPTPPSRPCSWATLFTVEDSPTPTGQLHTDTVSTGCLLNVQVVGLHDRIKLKVLSDRQLYKYDILVVLAFK